MSWQTRSSREIYRNAWINVREDEVVRPDGMPGTYGVVGVNRPAVFVVPVTEGGEVIMIRQHRYTTGVDSTEVPGGGMDDDAPQVAAARELREETGYAASTWRDLGPVYSLNGVADAPGRVFLATGLTHVGGDERAVEGISDVVVVPIADLVAMIGRQELTDNESLAALLLALVALERVRVS